jgi:hypothetical protein
VQNGKISVAFRYFALLYWANTERPHQTFNGATPLEVYKESIDGQSGKAEQGELQTACVLVVDSGDAGPAQARVRS